MIQTKITLTLNWVHRTLDVCVCECREHFPVLSLRKWKLTCIWCWNTSFVFSFLFGWGWRCWNDHYQLPSVSCVGSILPLTPSSCHRDMFQFEVQAAANALMQQEADKWYDDIGSIMDRQGESGKSSSGKTRWDQRRRWEQTLSWFRVHYITLCLGVWKWHWRCLGQYDTHRGGGSTDYYFRVVVIEGAGVRCAVDATCWTEWCIDLKYYM